MSSPDPFALPFPAGFNSEDTLIFAQHFNLTTLMHYNYTLYHNQTLSNTSRCILISHPYTPTNLLPNGTFLNSTSCFSPIAPLTARAITGIVFAILFVLSILLTFSNLQKHGRLLLPQEKRYTALGRRSMWYWMLAGAACGFTNCVVGVDVDRYYLPEFPIMLASLFWFLMVLCVMASVWEGVRHWGSWLQREMYDSEILPVSQHRRRAKVEFLTPLVFYFFFCLAFFMIFPRSWTAIEKQRSPSQTRQIAMPAATDIRFKIGALSLLCSWLTTLFSLCHSLKHCKAKSHSTLLLPRDLLRLAPPKFRLSLSLSLFMVVYVAACALKFDVSPLNIKGNLVVLFVLGWAVPLSNIAILEIWGFLDSNEDEELIRQRRIRGAKVDPGIAVTGTPHWWRKLNNVQLSGGVQPRAIFVEGELELCRLPAASSAGKQIDTQVDVARPNERTRPVERQTCQKKIDATGNSLAGQIKDVKSMLDI